MRRSITLSVLLVGLLLLLAALLFFRRANAQYGAALALCPGPDLYGYTCEGGTAFAYIDATTDTRLYQDDGVTQINLPFPFTFYGTTYENIYASSNGNLQFGPNPSAQYSNRCIANGVDPAQGDMIAPFWDDLDLTAFGYLETELVGDEPGRIFVIEWDDIPIFGNSDDRVTFEVQLFEEDNHILFLYNDVTLIDGNNGASATIGLQSAAQGVGLQYGCNQPVVANASQIRFVHPQNANADVGGVEVGAPQGPAAQTLAAKGVLADLLAGLARSEAQALPELNRRWRQQMPPRTAVWEWVDLQQSSANALLLVWRGTAAHPLTRLVLIQTEENGAYRVELDTLLSQRDDPSTAVVFAGRGDVTGDEWEDILLHDPESGHAFVISAQTGTPVVYPLPVNCRGSIAILNEVERALVVADGCADVDGRVTFPWVAGAFQAQMP
jgi:hypothetical protein